MKKSLLTWLLFLTTVVVAQQSAPPQSAPPQSAPPPAPSASAAQPQQKTIKDPAEYNAYIAAVQTTDPAQRSTALEAFLQSYSNSVMKEDATELLLKTYQQLVPTDPQKYTQKVLETGQHLLAVDPNNLTGLALLSYMDRSLAQGGGPNGDQLLQQARQYGERGLKQLEVQQKQEGYTDEQWDRIKQDFRQIFLGSIGHAALQSRDYPTAQQTLLQVVQADPTNFTNVYLLALSYLEPPQVDPRGLFWIARAVAVAPAQMPAAQLQTIQRYGRAKYVRYHGAEDGWDQLIAMAKDSPAPPANFTVTSAPSAGDQAAAMVQKTAPEELSFADWQFILSSGNQEAADKVWNAIKGKPLRMVVQVISVSGNTLQLAGSEDDIQANKADIELTLSAPLAAGRAPKPGTEVTIQGVPATYTPNPFLMRMTDGQIVARAAPTPPRPAPKKPAR